MAGKDVLSSKGSGYKKMLKIEAYIVTTTLNLESVKKRESLRPVHDWAFTPENTGPS